jgi:hypothetical protein
MAVVANNLDMFYNAQYDAYYDLHNSAWKFHVIMTFWESLFKRGVGISFPMGRYLGFHQPCLYNIVMLCNILISAAPENDALVPKRPVERWKWVSTLDLMSDHVNKSESKKQ